MIYGAMGIPVYLSMCKIDKILKFPEPYADIYSKSKDARTSPSFRRVA
jgi:hypothetical protein